MIIRLKDGSEKEYAQPMSVFDIAKDISEGLARNACAGQVNGETVDLRTIVSEDSDLNILTFNDDEGKLAFRHTASRTCTGSEALVSRSKACNWTGNRRRFLL